MQESLAVRLKKYQPSSEATELIRSTRILFLVGPTGAGKDALKEKLIASGGFHHIVSHTTRPPRINHGVLEENGVDYHFISQNEALSMLDNKDFIEAKIFSGNLYGTSLAEIKKARDEGHVAVTDIEIQGVAEYMALDPSILAVFLLPPSFKIWQERLKKRYGDVVDAHDHMIRLHTALNEINELLTHNYYTPVVNEELNETYNKILNIIETKTIDASDRRRALEVARELAKDIEKYLSANEH